MWVYARLHGTPPLKVAVVDQEGVEDVVPGPLRVVPRSSEVVRELSKMDTSPAAGRCQVISIGY